MLVGCLLGTVDKSLLSGLTDFVRSWEEIFDFPFHESNPYNFFNGGGSTTFYRGLPRVCKLSKTESLAPKLSILHNSISQKWDQFSK